MGGTLKISWTIASRYVRPTRLSVISVIGIVSVLGIVIGTAALILVSSLFNGFRGVAYDLMIGFGPHAIVTPAHGYTFSDESSTTKAVEQVFANTVGYSTQTTVTSAKMVVQVGDRNGVSQVIALSNPKSDVCKGLRQSVIVGSYSFNRNAMPGAIVSSGLAELLRLRIADTITLLDARQIEQSVLYLTVPQGRRFLVSGIFQSNVVRDADAARLYVSEAAFGGNGMVGRKEVYVNVQKPRELPVYIKQIQSQINAVLNANNTMPAPNDGRDNAGQANEADPASTHRSASHTVTATKDVITRTWQDANRGLVNTMRLESLGSFVVVALVVLVASFNVLVSLTLGVVQKRKDIAVLLAMGLTRRNILTVYLLQGLTIGVVSAVLGLAIGLGLCWGQLTFHWIAFDMAKGYLIPYLPLEVQTLDVVLVTVVGLLLSGSCALYPALRASRTVASSALRTE